tara:strand:- start:241 stop:423 length:183 start_codon:yes stop_codon:yes gene_type:complete
MIESTQTVKVSGTLTNDAWGGESCGSIAVVYISDEDITHDIRNILADFRDKKVEITIKEI